MRTVECPASDLVISPDGSRRSWDGTAHVRELMRAEPRPRSILVVLGAQRCNGCEILASQLERSGTALRDVEVLKVSAGDFPSGQYANELVVGHASFQSPGVPLALLFGVSGSTEATKLDFTSLLLGPLDERRPEATIEEMKEGKSSWVPEADGVRIAVCVGSLCFSLDRGNGFRQPFSIILPSVPARGGVKDVP